MNALSLSPAEVISGYCAGSVKKLQSPALRLFLLGVLAGAAANLIPVTLGNLVGGAGLGLLLWYCHIKQGGISQ